MAHVVGWEDIQVSKVNETELKHVIALLPEDAKRLQQLEPNAGTGARIWLAKEALESGDYDSEEAFYKAEGRAGYSPGLGGV
nr:hypothetical protein [Shigella dysenteriae]